MTPSVDALLGRDASELVPFAQTRLHQRVITPVEQLTAAAREAGFSLRIASGYRSFDRQRAIWTAKASGNRPVLDSRGQPLDTKRLSELEKVHAILRWSALPGASRHHWGTDMDVYDSAALKPGETLQLTQQECDAEGSMYRFHLWLSGYLRSHRNPGFYRPYSVDRGGVAPEPWHLSFAPVANVYARAMNVDVLARCLECESLPMQSTVLAHLPALFARYVRVPQGPDEKGDQSKRLYHEH